MRGQKTGFFVDQRENRSLLEHYAKGKSVLNMFCYTGGFSVYAMRGEAKAVHSVDSSAKAIELTNENIALNFPEDARHEAICEDAFKYLDEHDQQYDLIVLDPPAFAKHRAALRNALKGYTRLNVKGLQRIKKGGILLPSVALRWLRRISSAMLCLLLQRRLEERFASCTSCTSLPTILSIFIIRKVNI